VPATIPPLDPRLRDIDRLRSRTRMFDAVIDEVRGRRIRVGDDWLDDWASCNYLGLDQDPDVTAAVADTVRRWGTHPGWSRMLGSPRAYPELEARLADLLGTEDALLLPTISQIHLAVIPALAGTGTVMVERSAHRTIYDGCTHARGLGASLHRFRGHDPDALADLLRAAPPGPRIVCMDGVNSMTGDIPNLADHARLCREYDALLYIDDAHGFGVIGEHPDERTPYGTRGNAVVRHRAESYDNIVLVAGLSKAYSSLLAFLAVPSALKEYLKVAAVPYLYSGPSPFASLASAQAGLDVNDRRGDALRAAIHRMTSRILSHVHGLGVATLNTTNTPIIELPVAAGLDLVDVAEDLWRRGLYVTLAPYPGVSRDVVGFRLQVTAAHTDEQVDHLIDVLTGLAADGTLRREGGDDPRPPTKG
jgi:8-amino-7-oxononanoate synthase